ncbi:disease resistance protein PIK6-NP-like [Lolium rigidum]|uniref:disease resistance protein PIK6-NP-like n=1 Tax=Lolium rigidum TaxID=89674 RepID=UPI001F5D4F9E|nr:disease resistance protein PIK6-NP-like [Lolium rigidum]
MEGALVSAAAGALKPVLGKLATLLGDEYKRFRRVRKEIGFITQELVAMEAFLLKKSMEEEDPDIQDKVWMNEVRELSYDIEDSLDDFMKIKNLLDKTKDRRQIADAIEDLKKQVYEASERRKRYTAGEVISKVNNVTVDPRALAIFENASNLVGIDGPKKEIIKLFTQETKCESRQQQIKMISIVGFGGLGKTTLAFQVYQELKEKFDCHAFVSVSRNPDMKTVLISILSQVTDEDYSKIEDIPQLITRISNFLAEKRYIIVVDDIWNVEIWDVIKFAFPRSGYDCRIITTTRLNNVAQSCHSSFSGHIYNMDPLSMLHSRKLFHTRLFNSEECPSHLEEVSSQILDKCAGLPLAIIAISGLLANKAKTKDQWHQVRSSFGHGLERNFSIEAMMKIISLSYIDLPHHLKTCLLYLSIFPEDHVIGKEMLIRRWIPEGFIHKKYGYTLYEAGEMCFSELMNRSLIQPDFKEQVFDEVTCCRVHDMVLDFIVSKSTEENFVTIIGVPGINPDPQNKVRRLSLQNNGEIPAGLILSDVRSLSIFGCDVKISSLSEFKHLRVLCFEDCWQIKDHHLAGIGKLIHLKCLSLSHVGITKVPEEIAILRYLETLDIDLRIKEDVEILRSLPSLRFIWVRYHGAPADQLKAAMEIMIAAHPNHPKLERTQYTQVVPSPKPSRLPLLLQYIFRLFGLHPSLVTIGGRIAAWSLYDPHLLRQRVIILLGAGTHAAGGSLSRVGMDVDVYKSAKVTSCNGDPWRLSGSAGCNLFCCCSAIMSAMSDAIKDVPDMHEAQVPYKGLHQQDFYIGISTPNMLGFF